jgi:peptidoglycan/xylan/chitin deacetylase (PgdA/CDA1 family)
VNPDLVAIPAVAAAVAVTAYGAAHPRSQLFGPAISRTPGANQLAITFDDGPNPAITPKLLDLLDRHQARATFFVIGRFARENPSLLKEISARGHAIGNHTETHPNLFFLAPAKIREELRRCQDAIANALGSPAQIFRPPFGLRNPWLASATAELNLRTIMWTLLPGDWRQKSSDWLIQRMAPIAAHAQNAKTLPPDVAGAGDILCLHDGSHRLQNADRSHTVAALEFCLPRWRELGLQFVTINPAVRTPAL